MYSHSDKKLAPAILFRNFNFIYHVTFPFAGVGVYRRSGHIATARTGIRIKEEHKLTTRNEYFLKFLCLD